jgi:hypothetical protein
MKDANNYGVLLVMTWGPSLRECVVEAIFANVFATQSPCRGIAAKQQIGVVNDGGVVI